MQLLAAATSAMRSGRLAEAQDLCRQALATNPNNADAYNLLGVISGGTGNHKAAADYMRQAAAV
ncbi:MAG: tetratricopeptide repeat protein, partial [Planctomycetales bacterium]|nr:tetratricopeptide repeat protein [Planctomycetales bacterium]